MTFFLFSLENKTETWSQPTVLVCNLCSYRSDVSKNWRKKTREKRIFRWNWRHQQSNQLKHWFFFGKVIKPLHHITYALCRLSYHSCYTMALATWFELQLQLHTLFNAFVKAICEWQMANKFMLRKKQHQNRRQTKLQNVSKNGWAEKRIERH